MRVRSLIAGVLVAFSSLSSAAQDYRPKLAVSESMQPFLKHLEPGDDGFPLEARANELESRLEELSKALRDNRDRVGDVTKSLLDPAFRGARLVPADGSAQSQAALDVQRAKELPQALDLDATQSGAELRRLVQDLREVTVAEFLITAIDGDASSNLHTTVRYDIVGGGKDMYRVEHVGEWDLNWRRNPESFATV